MPIEQDDTLNARLEAFASDTARFMNEQPPKMDADGNPVAGFTAFSHEDIATNHFVEARDTTRNTTLASTPHVMARAASTRNDNPANLVDTLRYTRLNEMENAGLKSARLSETPWSDDYWAIYKGILGARYADPKFPESPDWKKNADYILANPATDILASRSAHYINRLSPAEKYDALVGDAAGSLTQRMWSEGKRYYDANGSVETWMGICHGWAPAAYMLDRPVRPVTLHTPDNIPIKFYPADIKALASLIWANAASRTRFIGGRCNDKDPATDPETGRVISERCFDTNPGTWHVAVVNQVGVSRRSFVMDVTFDYEVWNQPIYSYEYRYFNPQTRRATGSLADATVAIGDYTNDKFKRFRSNRTQSVVGVSMTIKYMVETYPQQRDHDTPDMDAAQSVTYEYDLELDAEGDIIGGEWYRNKHPDFLWTPPKGARAESRLDNRISGSWSNVRRAVPVTWRSVAAQAARDQGAPLAAIVEKIIEFANAPDNAAEPEPDDNDDSEPGTDNNPDNTGTNHNSGDNHNTDDNHGNSGAHDSGSGDSGRSNDHDSRDPHSGGNNTHTPRPTSFMEWLRAMLRRWFG
ncbi:MAG: hypothetical protein CSA79_01820 [Thiothrix nivea]|nr:MAG: hypothetical protein CSA79_01820 [Thiothrix nivea]